MGLMDDIDIGDNGHKDIYTDLELGYKIAGGIKCSLSSFHGHAPTMTPAEREAFGKIHSQHVAEIRNAAPLPRTIIPSPERLAFRKRFAERQANVKIICREVFGVEWGRADQRQKEWCATLHRMIEWRAYEGYEPARFTLPCEFLPRSEEDGLRDRQETAGAIPA